MQEKVLFYEGKWYMFSNFSAFAVMWDGFLHMTSEHAYQAAKFDDLGVKTKVRQALSAYDSKVVAHQFKEQMRPNWRGEKLDVMRSIVRAKLQQHPKIQEKLLKTGDKEIVENSPTDDFWGRGPIWRGENHLGKIWMQLRSELQQQT